MSLLSEGGRSAQAMALIRRLAAGAAYRRLFAGPDGETMLTDLLREAGMLTTSQVPGDPHATAFNEGKRALALFVLDRLRWTEADIVKLANRRADDDRARMAGQEE